MTYGQCVAYSSGTVDMPIPIGGLVKFPSPTNFIIASPRLLEAIETATGPEIQVNTDEEALAKRPCLRPLVEGGEQEDDTGEKLRGMSTYLLDLDGVKHSTRNKTVNPQRERDLYLVFRTMDREKWEYAVSTDLILQPENYRSMICEQRDTQSGERHSAFISCSLISRIQRLRFFYIKIN